MIVWSFVSFLYLRNKGPRDCRILCKIRLFLISSDRDNDYFNILLHDILYSLKLACGTVPRIFFIFCLIIVF